MIAVDVGHTRIAAAAYRAPDAPAESLRHIDTRTGDPAALFVGFDPQSRANIAASAQAALPAVLSAATHYFTSEPNVLRAAGFRTAPDVAPGVGIDRLLNVTAAHRQTGGPVLSVDAGTAITFDIGDGAGVFIGGLIVPGPQAAAEGLRARAPHLPAAAFGADAPPFGRNTADALAAGLSVGFCALIEGTIVQLRAILPPQVRVFMTGGLTEALRGRLTQVDVFQEDLTLRGIAAYESSFRA